MNGGDEPSGTLGRPPEPAWTSMPALVLGCSLALGRWREHGRDTKRNRGSAKQTKMTIATSRQVHYIAPWAELFPR